MREEVLLIHDYCPCCLKPKPGGSSLAHRDDARIDRLQALHAQKNSLRLLDFSKVGECCAKECQIRCMVCGFPVLMGFEPGFEDARRFTVERDWEGMRELSEECGARFAEGWNRLVHLCCAVRTKCGCWIPRQLNRFCPVHDRKQEVKRVEKRREMVEKQPSSAWTGLMGQMKQAVPKPKKVKRKPGDPKPKKKKKNPVVVKKSPPKPVKKSPPKPVEMSPPPSRCRDDGSYRKKRRPEFDDAPKREWLSHDAWVERKRAEQVEAWGGFDESRHGYFRVDGELIYRHPNGRVYPATGVDQFDE